MMYKTFRFLLIVQPDNDGANTIEGLRPHFYLLILLCGVESSRVTAHSYLSLHGNAVEGYYSLIVPCMEMGPRTTVIHR
jgi:hypothetical protein